MHVYVLVNSGGDRRSALNGEVEKGLNNHEPRSSSFQDMREVRTARAEK